MVYQRYDHRRLPVEAHLRARKKKNRRKRKVHEEDENEMEHYGSDELFDGYLGKNKRLVAGKATNYVRDERRRKFSIFSGIEEGPMMIRRSSVELLIQHSERSEENIEVYQSSLTPLSEKRKRSNDTEVSTFTGMNPLVLNIEEKQKRRQAEKRGEEFEEIKARLAEIFHDYGGLNPPDEKSVFDMNKLTNRKFREEEASEKKILENQLYEILTTFSEACDEREDLLNNICLEEDDDVMRMTDIEDLDDFPDLTYEIEITIANINKRVAKLQDLLAKLSKLRLVNAGDADRLSTKEKSTLNLQKMVIGQFKKMHSTKQKQQEKLDTWKYAANEIVDMIHAVRKEGNVDLNRLEDELNKLVQAFTTQRQLLEQSNQNADNQKQIISTMEKASEKTKVENGLLQGEVDRSRVNIKTLKMKIESLETRMKQVQQNSQQAAENGDKSNPTTPAVIENSSGKKERLVKIEKLEKQLNKAEIEIKEEKINAQDLTEKLKVAEETIKTHEVKLKKVTEEQDEKRVVAGKKKAGKKTTTKADVIVNHACTKCNDTNEKLTQIQAKFQEKEEENRRLSVKIEEVQKSAQQTTQEGDCSTFDGHPALKTKPEVTQTSGLFFRDQSTSTTSLSDEDCNLQKLATNDQRSMVIESYGRIESYGEIRSSYGRRKVDEGSKECKVDEGSKEQVIYGSSIIHERKPSSVETSDIETQTDVSTNSKAGKDVWTITDSNATNGVDEIFSHQSSRRQTPKENSLAPATMSMSHVGTNVIGLIKANDAFMQKRRSNIPSTPHSGIHQQESIVQHDSLLEGVSFADVAVTMKATTSPVKTVSSGGNLTNKLSLSERKPLSEDNLLIQSSRYLITERPRPSKSDTYIKRETVEHQEETSNGSATYGGTVVESKTTTRKQRIESRRLATFSTMADSTSETTGPVEKTKKVKIISLITPSKNAEENQKQDAAFTRLNNKPKKYTPPRVPAKVHPNAQIQSAWTESGFFDESPAPKQEETITVAQNALRFLKNMSKLNCSYLSDKFGAGYDKDLPYEEAVTRELNTYAQHAMQILQIISFVTNRIQNEEFVKVTSYPITKASFEKNVAKPLASTLKETWRPYVAPKELMVEQKRHTPKIPFQQEESSKPATFFSDIVEEPEAKPINAKDQKRTKIDERQKLLQKASGVELNQIYTILGISVSHGELKECRINEMKDTSQQQHDIDRKMSFVGHADNRGQPYHTSSANQYHHSNNDVERNFQNHGQHTNQINLDRNIGHHNNFNNNHRYHRNNIRHNNTPRQVAQINQIVQNRHMSYKRKISFGLPPVHTSHIGAPPAPRSGAMANRRGNNNHQQQQRSYQLNGGPQRKTAFPPIDMNEFVTRSISKPKAIPSIDMNEFVTRSISKPKSMTSNYRR